MSVSSFDEITKTEPEKSLTEPLKKSGGRNANGRITRRHQGGGHKRQYRQIDFKRIKDGVPAKVAAIEYDPNRSARIALLHYADGAKAYILAPARLRVGAVVEAWGKQTPLIVVAQQEQEAIAKSFRNLQGVHVVTPSEVEISALVWARSLLVSEGALELVQGRAS